MPMTVSDVNIAEMARQLGIAEGTCAVLLSEVRQREPHAAFCIQGGDELRALVTFEHGDLLELVCRQGFVTIGAYGGFPGEQYCMLIPQSSITNAGSAAQFKAQFSEAELVTDEDLSSVLAQRMAPVYQRIATIRSR